MGLTASSTGSKLLQIVNLNRFETVFKPTKFLKLDFKLKDIITNEDEKTINYYILYHKLSSLRYLKYEYFRSTVFDCMSLLGKN